MSTLPLCQCGCGNTVSKMTNRFCYGHKGPNPRGTPEQRFWKYVYKTESCWLWIGATQSPPYNYGVLNINGQIYRAHRLSWQFFYGPIPGNMEICHNCPSGDNPNCVNPDHLFLGTHQDNMLDCVAKGNNPAVTDPNMPTRARGSRIGTAKITEEDVIVMRASRPQITLKQLAEQFHLHVGTVWAICARRTWKHVS